MHKTIPESLELVNGLKKNLAGITDREILICPPFTALFAISQSIKGSNINLGAQNVHWETKGAFTGEVSVSMLLDAGCRYVIIGHSERRQYFGETDDAVNKKMHSVFKSGITPIVCIGETLTEREQKATLKVIERQVKTGITGLSTEQAKSLVIAYEPVWAIGTGKTATPQQAQEVHSYIRKLYTEIYKSSCAESVRILYGGSVKPDNMAELMKQPDIDGGLVGGASLDADSFVKIVRY